MSGVRTYVTVEPLKANRFGCTLNLVEFFDADEVPVGAHNFDFIVSQDEQKGWKTIGEVKVNLSPEDLNHLGSAIMESQA